MTRLSVATLAHDADRIFSRVADKGERIVLRKGNKNMAVLVSLHDAARLKRLSEDEEDIREFRKGMASAKKEGTVPLHAVKAKLGLD